MALLFGPRDIERYPKQLAQGLRQSKIFPVICLSVVLTWAENRFQPLLAFDIHW
jgi:hypothetical protein